jgi:hypothetical protein
MDNNAFSSPFRHPLAFEIYLRGEIHPRWKSLLEDLSINSQPDGLCLLTGSVPDQAALLGLLMRLYSLGFSLVSVSVHPAGPHTP